MKKLILILALASFVIVANGQPVNGDTNKIETDLGEEVVVEIGLIEKKPMPIKIAEIKPGALGYLVYDDYIMTLSFSNRKFSGVQIAKRVPKGLLLKVEFKKPFEPIEGKYYTFRFDSKRLSHELIFDFQMDSSGGIFVPR